MTDSEHLMWILDRMIHVHGEKPNIDYMLRLHQIARKVQGHESKSHDEVCSWDKFVEHTEKFHDGMDCFLYGKTKSELGEAAKEIKVLEWQVGDDAILTNENDYGITHGTEAIGEKVKVMSLFKDGDLDMAVIKHDITNYCFRVDMLQKPKTKDEILRDDLMEMAVTVMSNDDFDLDHNCYYLISGLMKKYSINPQ